MFTADLAFGLRSVWYSPGPGASSGQTDAPPGASCPVAGILNPAKRFAREPVPSSGQCSPGPGPSALAPSNTPPGASFVVPKRMFTPVDFLRSAPGPGSNSPGPGPLRNAASNTPPGASFPAPLPMFTADLPSRAVSLWYSPGPGRPSWDLRVRSRRSAMIDAPRRGSGFVVTSPAYSPGPGASTSRSSPRRRSPMRYAGDRLSIMRRTPRSVS